MRLLFGLLVFIFSIQVKAQPLFLDKQLLKQIKQPPCTSVKDQYMSSTCWSFAGNSFLESELLKKGIATIDLSEMYTARLAWIEKINLHLVKKGANYLTPGSQFHNIQRVSKEYGIVPEIIYNGKPNGEINHNHAALDTAITRFVIKLVKSKKKQPSASDWKYINNLLDKYLGKLPTTFNYQGKQYSPQSFMKNYLGINLDDYIEITSYSHHPYYTPFIFENKYNYSYDKYMNVPLEDFIAITDSALLNGNTIVWNGDVTDDGFDFYNAKAELTDLYTDVANMRQQTFADSTSYMDHMMHIVNVFKDSSGHKWYYIKNSWGNANSLHGFMLMDENYFTIKTAAIVVNKKTFLLLLKENEPLIKKLYFLL